MPKEIVVALIGVFGVICTAIASIIVQVYASKKTRNDLLSSMQHQSEMADEKIKAQLERNQAVTDTKIEELTREVREHNNFARRMPVVEERIEVANHRIADLEKFQAQVMNDGK